MSPKTRNKENRYLPKRWRLRAGKYRYQVPVDQRPYFDNRKEFTLGETLSESHLEFNSRMAKLEADLNQGVPLRFETMCDLIDYYERVVTPTKAAATQDPERRALGQLRAIYGLIAPRKLTHGHINQVKHAVSAKRGVRTANGQIAILSHVCTMGIEWGALERHPMINKQVTRVKVDKKKEPKTNRFEPTDEQLTAALKLCTTPIIPAYLAIKNRTGLRQTSILKIKLPDITMLPEPIVVGEDEILAIGSIDVHLKGGSRGTVYFDADLYEWIEVARRCNRSNHHTPWLFQTRNGTPYIDAKDSCSSFGSLWQRWQSKIEKAGMQRFAERYIRNKVANDSASLADAQERLTHASPKITASVYRTTRNIIPLKKKD